jgi:hypothetical protein
MMTSADRIESSSTKKIDFELVDLCDSFGNQPALRGFCSFVEKLEVSGGSSESVQNQIGEVVTEGFLG